MAHHFNFHSSTSEASPDSYVAEVKNSKFTDGHFPDNPILPAYALLIMAAEVLEHHLKDKSSDYRLSGSKFSRPIKPDSPILVSLKFTPQSLHILIKQDDKKSAQVTFSPLSLQN